MSGNKEKVVLAYSGGLDTTCCIKWLQEEKDLDVICVMGEVGQNHGDVEAIKAKALRSGAIGCEVVDLRDVLANAYLTKALRANGLYENKYPLLSALSRPGISKSLVDAAHVYGAKYIAHGCTGKGNDQVRFEASIALLDPSLNVLGPVREWDFNTRPEEVQWALARGLEVPTGTNDVPYSIDDNLWGRAIECGILEDPWNEPPDDVWVLTTSPQLAPDDPAYIEIAFNEGIPCALNGEELTFRSIIEKLNVLAGSHGVGRLDIIENRLVGVKSRECYETPAASVLITAHKALEDLVLERDVLHYKLGIEQSWATAVYNGLWFSPLKEALDAFIDSTQRCVTGVVRVKLYKGTATVVGLKSPYSLYDYGLATYDKSDTFDHWAASGFIALHTLAAKTWARNRRQEGIEAELFEA